MAAFALIVGAYSPAFAERAIIYGGMGFLATEAQPVLSRIFDGRSEAGVRHRRSIETQIRDSIQRTDLAWSDHPIIVDRSDARAVAAECAREQGIEFTSEYPVIGDLRDLCGRVFVLSLVADLELHVKRQTVGDDKVYIDILFAGVSAVLSDPEDRSIVMSTTAFGETMQEHGDGFIDRAEAESLFAQRFAQTGKRALSQMAAQMRRTPITDAFDRHMVVGTLVSDASALPFFDLAAWQGMQGRTLCDLPTQCHGSVDCMKLFGLTASASTAALSKAGYMTMPPRSWTYWTGRARDLISVRLALPRGGYWEEEELRMTAPPSDAEVKVIAHVPHLRYAERDDPSSDYLSQRVHEAILLLRPYRTAYESCAQVTEELPPMAGEDQQIVLFATAHAEAELSYLRAMSYVTLINSSKRLAGNNGQ